MAQAPPTPRVRFDYLDSLRALAALTVVVLHAFQQYGLGLNDWGVPNVRGGLGDGLVDALIAISYDRLVRWAFFAVQVFIIISGFSLMITVARSSDARLGGGLLDFFRRRARRILPPYYASLALSLLVIAVVPGMNARAGVYWDTALPALEARTVLLHLLLLHNWDWDTHFAINPPMWSIAVEWQIYFLFPLLVVLWRVWGARVTLPLALAWGLVPVVLPVRWFPLSHAWFVGLFALGMLGASLSLSPHPTIARWRDRVPWIPLAVISSVAFVGFASLTGRLGVVAQTEWLRDYLLGVAVTCVLIRCTRLSVAPPARRPLYLRALLLPPLVRVGRFSYSLYLIHAPVIALLALGCRALQLPVLVGYGIVVAVGIPLAVLVAYLFFLPFERPFLASRPPRTRGERAGGPDPERAPADAAVGEGAR
jgi:peptidoglycan/LPS O-acetylase OafA/YrhL